MGTTEYDVTLSSDNRSSPHTGDTLCSCSRCWVGSVPCEHNHCFKVWSKACKNSNIKTEASKSNHNTKSEAFKNNHNTKTEAFKNNHNTKKEASNNHDSKTNCSQYPGSL